LPVSFKPGDAYEKLAAKAKRSFQRFWNADRNCCFDVIDAPSIGNDAALRPNQIFAVSLPVSPLTPEQQKAVVDVCARQLLTRMDCGASRRANLDIPAITAAAPAIATPLIIKARSGAGCSDPSHSHTTASTKTRNGAAFPRAARPPDYASGLGTLSEIFDGDAPFTPAGHRASLDRCRSFAGLEENSRRKKTSHELKIINIAEFKQLSARL